MNFGQQSNGEPTKAKAWRDIWGSGQGIGTVTAVETVEARVARMEAQYDAARARLMMGVAA